MDIIPAKSWLVNFCSYVTNVYLSRDERNFYILPRTIGIRILRNSDNDAMLFFWRNYEEERQNSIDNLIIVSSGAGTI